MDIVINTEDEYQEFGKGGKKRYNELIKRKVKSAHPTFSVEDLKKN